MRRSHWLRRVAADEVTSPISALSGLHFQAHTPEAAAVSQLNGCYLKSCRPQFVPCFDGRGVS